MGRHQKLPAAKPAPPVEEQSALDTVEAGLRMAFDTCAEAIKDGSAAPQIVREFGGLGRAIASVHAERRQQEKARKWTVENLPVEMAVERLKLLPADQLQHVLNELARLNSQDSVLG